MERFELENSREFKAAMELENALNDMCFVNKRFGREYQVLSSDTITIII